MEWKLFEKNKKFGCGIINLTSTGLHRCRYWIGERRHYGYKQAPHRYCSLNVHYNIWLSLLSPHLCFLVPVANMNNLSILLSIPHFYYQM